MIPPPTIRTFSNDLQAPYTINSTVSLESAFDSRFVVSASYDFIRGVHLFRSRNINAPLPGVFFPSRPDPRRGNVFQVESTGESEFKGFTAGFRGRIDRVSLVGNYSISSLYNDADDALSIPSNSYDLRSDWGRAPAFRRHHFWAGPILYAPWDTTAAFLIHAASGAPFNITTGFDDNADGVLNDRPSGTPRNSGLSPATVTLDTKLSKAITFSNSGRDRKIGLTVFTYVQNLLNRRNESGIVGVLTSPLFGFSTSVLAGRRLELGARLTF
jgi:hypothetical protein